MTTIMVSYSRKDSAVARKLIDAFEKVGIDVWVDWEDIPPAVGWLDQILRGIEESDAFIFLVSPDSIASEVCKVEIGHAAKNNKRIIPVVIRDVVAKDVIETVRDLNWIFGREQDSFDECLNKIKLAIELDIDWVQEHKRLLIRALEWDRKKDISLLLRGRDLSNADRTVRLAVKKNPLPTELQHIYIHHSRRNERLWYAMWIAGTIALLIMLGLSWAALVQRDHARKNETFARQQESQARQNEAYAKQNEKKAKAAEAQARESEAKALESENTAKAQRSAAKAQIYQSIPGELYTSTLLAVDSWQRDRSSEAEQILRQNISLLPIPVDQMAQKDRINALEFSPSGDTFVTGSADGTACLWNVKDGKQLFCATSYASVNDAAFSPDGELIATGDQSGHVMIIDTKSGAVQNEIIMLQGAKNPALVLKPGETASPEPSDTVTVWDVNFSPNGDLLAIARDDGNVIFIDLRSRKYDFGFYASGSLMVSAFSPNGLWFATGSTDGSVTLWNFQSNKTVQAPPHHGEVLCIKFSPDSNRLVSGGTDSLALVSVTSTGAKLFPIVNEDWVENIAFSPDGSWFVTVSDDKRVRVWDSNTGKEKLRMLQDSFVTAVEVSFNGQWIATTGADQTIRLWNSSTGAQIFQIPLNASGSKIAFSRDDHYLVSGDGSGEINIWDISKMVSPTNYIQLPGFATGVQFSASGDLLAASDENRVWLLNKGQFTSLTASLPTNANLKLGGGIEAVRLSPDSKWVGIATQTGELILYNVQTGERKTILQSDPAPQFVFSPDSQQIFASSADGKVQALEVTSDNVVNTLLDTGSGVASLAVSEKFLAVGVTDGVLIWDLNSGEMLPQIDSAGEHALMALGNDGSLLAATNSSGEIDIYKWNSDHFELLNPVTPVNHVFSMTFNPAGDQLFVGGQDLVQVFDLQAGGEIGRIPHRDAVEGISFSPDGKTLATASSKVVQFWDVASIPVFGQDQLVETACMRMIQNFDQAQWTAFFGKDDPFRILCGNVQE